MHCFFYSKEMHRCLHRKIPVGNVNTCDDWRPALFVLEMKGDVGFVLYDQYKIKDKKKENENGY